MELLGAVALLQDVPSQGLVRGQIGTIVQIHDVGNLEVEFLDKDGHTCALTALRKDQVVGLVLAA